MLTVKIVFHTGQESIFTAEQANWDPRARILRVESTGYELPEGSVAYVMNGSGATVARYSNEVKAQ